MFTTKIDNTLHLVDRSIVKPRTLKYIEAPNMGIENPSATPWIVSVIDRSGIKLAKKAPIILPSATLFMHNPIRKKVIPIWIYSWGV